MNRIVAFVIGSVALAVLVSLLPAGFAAAEIGLAEGLRVFAVSASAAFVLINVAGVSLLVLWVSLKTLGWLR